MLGETPSQVEILLEGREAAWRMTPYDRGWRFAVVDLAGGAPVGWYTGHTIRTGGEAVVAPDRAYDVTSARLKAMDWKVLDGDEVLLVVQGRGRKGGPGFRLDVRSAPEHAADLGPLTVVMALVALVSGQDLATHGRMGWLDGDIPLP